MLNYQRVAFFVRWKDGLKYAILCRVLCGVPGDDSSASDDKDCVILKAGKRCSML